MWVKARSPIFHNMNAFTLGYFESKQVMIWHLRFDGEWVDLYYDKNWFEIRTFY